MREEGTVLQVGPEDGKQAPAKVGDRVCFNRFAGKEINFDGELYQIMSFDDITAVYED